jgi:serine/threonine protein kinase
MPEQSIGRFKVIKELGKGGQGAVYLAHDPQFDRHVAIKTLLDFGSKTEQLIHEAHIVSKLQHPNIITLYDTGEHQGTLYLVYAHIEGKTLAQILKLEKTLSLVRATEIICGILEGLVYAHSQGVTHLDVKPSNVIIANSGMSMLVDFGLAYTINDPSQTNSQSTGGTPQYMAPERISGKQVSFPADIYSVGVMLYELVTGESAVSGQSVSEVLSRAANTKIAAPSTKNERVDEKLEAIILKATARNPDERYPSAELMKQALQDYLGDTNAATSTQGDAQSTLEFLLRRIRSESDFPALSYIISEINKIVSSESEGSGKLARTILQDFALTNKLLKLVNTASYGQFGGTINTISKAVVILGFETVRNIAMTLILLEFMQNKAQAAQLKDEILRSILTSVVSAQLSAKHHVSDSEEMIVCSMFHNLGRMLATFYFFDESQEISRLIERGEDQDKASMKVLGVTYSQLGVSVAQSWHFPPRLIAGMRKLTDKKIHSTHSDLESLTVTVNLAHELCDIAATTPVSDKKKLLINLTKRYENAFNLTERELTHAVKAGLSELMLRTSIMGISTAKNTFLENVRKWIDDNKPEESAVEVRMDNLEGITQLDETISLESMVRHSPEEELGAGIQDVTSTLMGEYNLNDVLQMILEAIYRGIGFSRAIILIRDNKQNLMAARFGFGAEINAVIQRFRFSLTSVPDAFHLSIEKGLDIAIEDTHSPNIAGKIPTWYRDTINAPCFILLPIMVKEKAIGLIYADMVEAHSLNLSQQQLSLLRTLRNQAVLAIKLKS